MSETKKESPLYYHARLEAYECLGCGEMLEAPSSVRSYAEDRLLWLEMQELDHARCAQFHDVAKARDQREHRRNVLVMPKRSDAAAL